MKKLMLTVSTLLVAITSMAQLQQTQTKRIMTQGHMLGWKHDITLYEDSIVINLVGGLMTKKIIKDKEGRTVIVGKVKTESAGVSTVYTILSENTRVIYTKAKSRHIITVERKDSFTGDIVKTMYY